MTTRKSETIDFCLERLFQDLDEELKYLWVFFMKEGLVEQQTDRCTICSRADCSGLFTGGFRFWPTCGPEPWQKVEKVVDTSGWNETKSPFERSSGGDVQSCRRQSSSTSIDGPGIWSSWKRTQDTLERWHFKLAWGQTGPLVTQNQINCSGWMDGWSFPHHYILFIPVQRFINISGL